MSAWRMSSCCTLMSSPLPRNKVENVRRKVCRPINPKPARCAADLRTLCRIDVGRNGCLPKARQLAKTQSSSFVNFDRAFHRSMIVAKAGSSGSPAFEYLVLTSFTTPSTMARCTNMIEFSQSNSPHFSANNSLQRRPVAMLKATIVRYGSSNSASIRWHSGNVSTRGSFSRLLTPLTRSSMVVCFYKRFHLAVVRQLQRPVFSRRFSESDQGLA